MGAIKLTNLLRDAVAARQGGPDTTAKLLKNAFCMMAPEYAPVISAGERIATQLGVKLTPQGLDVSGLRQIIQGQAQRPERDGTQPHPWSGFVKRLDRLQSGAVLILGARGSGKTQLSVRLAETWRREHGYEVLGINMYRMDRRPWIHNKPIEVFADGMGALVEALNNDEDPPAEICRKVIIIDESSLSLHPGGQRHGIIAVERAIRQARHIQWLVIVVAHLTADLPVQLKWMDAVFVKEPQGKEAIADRWDSRELWERTTAAYKDLRRHGLQDRPVEGWVYAESESLGFDGMIPYDMASAQDPNPTAHTRPIQDEGGESDG